MARNLPDLGIITAARLGKECPVLPAMSEYDYSLLLVWPNRHPDNTQYHWMEPTCAFNFRLSYGNQWQDMRWVQFLCSDADITTQDRLVESGGDRPERLTATATSQPLQHQPLPTSAPQILETIPEGTDEDGSSNPSLLVYNPHDEALRKAGEEALHC